jgi:hypothetical protein
MLVGLSLDLYCDLTGVTSCSCISVVKKQKRRISDTIRRNSFPSSKPIIFLHVEIVKTVIFVSNEKLWVRK